MHVIKHYKYNMSINNSELGRFYKRIFIIYFVEDFEGEK